jgi:hypothetical protein
MSTTFEVYPATAEIPTFAAVLKRSAYELHRFLDSVGISARPSIQLSLRRKVDDSLISIDLKSPARWAEDTYAWFRFGNVPGGTDAYFEADADQIRDMWESERTLARYAPFQTAIDKAIDVGHCWTFRRSMGQNAITNVGYGIIAGSLAALTDGFVHSLDSAWDFTQLPAYPSEFLAKYFRPEATSDANFRDWSERCIGHLADELAT